MLEITCGENSDPNISIMSTYGDNNIGGNDVDRIITDMIYEEFKALTGGEVDLFDFDADDGVSKRQKLVSLVRLNQVANQAKERLSQSKSTKVTLAPFIQEPKIVNINMEISLDEFMNHKRVNRLGDPESVYEKFRGRSLVDIIGMTMECVDKCLEAAKCVPGDVSEIFLVGGSSSIGLVSEMIEEKFGKAPFKSKMSPALSISQGAAHYCNMIMMPTVKGPTVREKTIHPLGLEIAGRRFMQIVSQGMDIPREGLVVEAGELLTTNMDALTSMAIIVYENTVPAAGGAKTAEYVNQPGMKRLAGTQLRGIPQGPRGHEKVKVIFNVGQDNMLRVTARSTSADGVSTELSVDDLY
jgi:molecular chaperone DnaK (HSP70)